MRRFSEVKTENYMNHERKIPRPLILMILDGWGYSEEKEGNAIFAAKKPTFDRLWRNYPHTLLSASGLDVGLPPGQMGNSEVGHLHIGAARHVLQDLTKIDLAIQSGEFFKNRVLLDAIDATKKTKGAVHILGLLSPGGVHSRDLHLQAMAELAYKCGCKRIYVHAFLDGRDTPPKSALASIQSMERKLRSLGIGAIASICGRYYSMDRDKRWQRIQLAYDMLTQSKAEFYAQDAETALKMAYERGESDEFVKPTCIHKKDEMPIAIGDGDSIFFMNFRADRARELSYAFTDEQFNSFPRQVFPKLTAYVTLTEYAADLKVPVAYPPEDLSNVFGEVLEKNNLRQLRIAETEKYAHVTYFINGGREMPFRLEDRILVPSPKVSTYDLQPEMSALEVAKRLIAAILEQRYDVIICNFANPDMVGHTGNFKATVQAVEAVDTCLGKVLAALEKVQGEMIVIADHGNAEVMTDAHTHQAHTAHTTNPVPCIYYGRPAQVLKSLGKLIDLAPTMLYLLNITPPREMTGEKIFQLIA